MDLENSRVDPSLFPTWFYFFSYVLNEEPMLHIISNIFIIIAYIQSFMVAFAPLIVFSNTTEDTDKVIRLVYLFLGLVDGPNNLHYSKMWIHAALIVFFLIVMMTMVMWITFSHARRSSRIFLKLRGLLFIFVPNNFFYQSAMFIGTQLEDIDITKSRFPQVFLVCLNLVCLTIIIFFSIYISPLILKNPVMSRSSMPCRLFPDFHFMFHALAEYVYILQLLTIPNLHLQYLNCVIFAAYSIYDCVNIWKIPYLHYIDTATSIASNIVHATALPIALVFAKKHVSGYIFIAAMAEFILLIIAFTFILKARGKKYLSTFAKYHTIPQTDDQCLLLITEAVINNLVTKELILALEPAVETSGRLDLLSAYQYIKVLRSDSMDSFYSMKHVLLSLNMFRDFSPPQKYFIFELIHAISKQDTDPFLPLNNELIQKYQNYENRSSKFWDYMIQGKLKQGVKSLIELDEIISGFTLNFISYYYFFSNNEMIDQLKTDFMDNVSPLYVTDCKRSNEVKMTELHFRYASFIKLPAGDVARMIFGEREIEKFVTDESQKTLNFKFNIQPHVKKPLTGKTMSIFYCDILICIILFIACIIYPFMVLSKTNSVTEFHSFSSSLSNLSSSWAELSILIGYSTNQSLYELNTYPTQRKIVPINISEMVTSETLYRRINSTIKTLVESLRQILIKNAYYNTDESLTQIGKIFNDPTITYGKYENITEDDMAYMSMRTMMFFYSLHMLQNLEGLNPELANESELVEEFRQRGITYTAISHQTLKQIRESFQYIDSYIYNSIGPTSISTDYVRIFLIVIAICNILNPFILYWFRYSAINEVSKACIGNFRPKVFEEGYEIEEYANEVEEFSYSSVIPKISWSLLYFVVFSACMVGMWEMIYDSYYDAFSIHDTVISIHRMSVQASITMVRISLAWKKNVTTCQLSADESEQLFNDIYKYCVEFNETYINSDPIYNATHSLYNSKLPEAPTFHDFYKLVSLGGLNRVIAYFTRLIAMDLSRLVSPMGSNALHAYFNEVQEKSSQILQYLDQALMEKMNDTYVLCYFSVFCFFIALFSLPLIFWARYTKADALKIQLGRLILDLDTNFITKNQCFVEYIIGSKTGDLPWRKGSSIFDILNTSDTAILIINDHNSIMAFTSCVAELFAYQPEQLVGQHYTMLFTSKGEPPSKAHEFFFSRISDLLSMSNGCTAKIITGVTSDGKYIKLDIHACVFVYDTMKFVLFHLKSLGSISDFEEATTLCQGKIIEMFESSIPLRLFPPSEDGSRILSRKFFGGTIVFSAIDGTDIIKQSPDQEYGVLEKVEPLFCGSEDAIVLSNTGSYALIVFGNADNTRMHRVRGLKFIKEFLTESEKNCSQVSVMMNIDQCFEVVQFLPPAVPKEFDGKEIPAKESNMFCPWMTTDPFINQMNDLGTMLSVLRPNIVIMQANLSEPLEKYCKIMPVTLVNNTERFVGVAIEELPDPYVMLEELSSESTQSK